MEILLYHNYFEKGGFDFILLDNPLAINMKRFSIIIVKPGRAYKL
ncbi:MAG TPA: hypothetical protein VK469_01295 [Candidatus Kapabacteria bacterium]|nr:hypothetical protein [Candidatus Kapabacteria bacterium]